jgi:hypothetical protein
METRADAVIVRSCVSGLLLIISAALLMPAGADAATLTDQMKKRLCDRQERIASRITRALIDPSLCGNEQPTPEPTLALSANPTSITQGTTSTLSWSSTDATSCTASNGWSGTKSLSGTQPVSPSATTTYTLTCTGAGGTITKSETVNVSSAPAPSPTLTFVASSTSVAAGGTTTLAWASTNATSCTASGGWNGSKSLSGNQTVTVSGTTTYALDCTGAGGTVHKEVTVTTTQAPVPSITLTANPTSVTANGTSTLTWSTSNVTFCAASNAWDGSKSTSGSQQVTPSATSTYALSCGGEYGTTSTSVTVNVTPTPVQNPTLTLTASRSSVTPGAGSATSTLTWSSANASSCTASGGWSGNRGTSGTEIVQPSATTTYTLLCGNGIASTSQSVTIDFVPTPVTPSGKLLITEVMYDLTNSTTSPQGSESANEWVEIYNGTNGDIDLGSYFIGDASSTDALPSVVLEAGKFAIITASSTTADFWSFPNDAIVIVLSTNIGQNGFGNAGDAARLLDAASTTVDAVSWGSDTTAFSPSVTDVPENSGDSIGRISNTIDTDTRDDWERKTEPSPGQ